MDVPTAVDRRAVIGVISSLRTATGQADPYPLYARLRSMGSVIPAPWGGYLLTTHDVCEQVMRSREWEMPDANWRAEQQSPRWDGPSSREMADTLIWLNAPEHTIQRRFMSSVLGRDALNRLRPAIQGIVDRGLDRLAERIRQDGSADFVTLVSEVIPVSVMAAWLTLPESDHALLRQLTHDQVFTQELLPTRRQLAVSDEATLGLRQYFTSLIAERRRNPGPDVVSALIRKWDAVEPDPDVTDRTIYRLVMFMVLAALETSSTMLSTAVWLLAGDPRNWRSLTADPQQVPAAVEEVVRYDPPIHVASRIAAEETYLTGRQIRRGELVHALIASANHDPARHTDPEIFDIGRGGGHLSFGVGAHHCLGSMIARLEATVMVDALARRFPTLRLTASPTWAPRAVMRRITSVPVTA